MHAALDGVAVDHAVGKARRRMGAFVVGRIESAVDMVDGKRRVADGERLHRIRRDIRLRTHAHDIFRLHQP